MPAFFPYPGSKTKMMKHVVKLLPNHDHYVSVFGGSAADILFKPPSRLETYNDIDAQLHNLFTVALNGKGDALRERMANTHPRSRRVFLEALEIVKQPITDHVLSAWAFLVLTHQAFCLCHPQRMIASSWKRNKKPHSGHSMIRLPTTLDWVRRRMKNVQLDNLDWSNVIDSYDSPTTVFFLDPPYPPDAVEKQLYAYIMSIEEHRTMLKKLQAIKGKVVLCGYHTPLYDAMLAHWRHHDFPVHSNLSFRTCRPKRTEVVWMNY